MADSVSHSQNLCIFASETTLGNYSDTYDPVVNCFQNLCIFASETTKVLEIDVTVKL